MAQDLGFDPKTPSTANILSFLQMGVDKDFAFNALKVQISALSALTSLIWVEDPLVGQFFAFGLEDQVS